ncbi:hypothetical protein V8C42DRAFT_327618 [Trichoderma barbatum]
MSVSVAGGNAVGRDGGCRELATVLDPSCRSFGWLARKFRPGRSDLGASDGLKLPPRSRDEWTRGEGRGRRRWRWRFNGDLWTEQSGSSELTPGPKQVPESIRCGHAPGSCRLAGRRAEFLLPGCEAGWAKRQMLSFQCLDAKWIAWGKNSTVRQPLTARDGPALENLQLGTKRPFVSPELPQASLTMSCQSTFLGEKNRTSHSRLMLWLEMYRGRRKI